jgi:hypothetical protein
MGKQSVEFIPSITMPENMRRESLDFYQVPSSKSGAIGLKKYLKLQNKTAVKKLSNAGFDT